MLFVKNRDHSHNTPQWSLPLLWINLWRNLPISSRLLHLLPRGSQRSFLTCAWRKPTLRRIKFPYLPMTDTSGKLGNARKPRALLSKMSWFVLHASSSAFVFCNSSCEPYVLRWPRLDRVDYRIGMYWWCRQLWDIYRQVPPQVLGKKCKESHKVVTA